MNKYILTIGLFDKKRKVQLIDKETAKEKISNTLINHYGIFAFTMYDCNGVYKMQNSDVIVKEPSIRVEIATVENIEKEILQIIRTLKHKRILNQESIMLEISNENIYFK